MRFGGTPTAFVAAVVSAVLALALAGTAAASSRRPSATLSTLELAVVQNINHFRQSHGLPALKLSAQLDAAAQQHSQEMAADGYFAHTSVDGGAFWKRIQRFYGSAKFGYWTVGENLLWSSPDVSPSDALTMWENSPEHRANMLKPTYREIGISAVHVQAAPGTFGGRDVTIITTDFGARR
ncbi:MAG TPA: CAP domain-containing protein [Gaiellaceae bacterium]|nr:CAP domain-containing protein [Gaiellaceae bacterium]